MAKKTPDDVKGDVRLSGAGEPLPPELRRKLEEQFGRDLGDVRVHADPAAGSAAGKIGARAFALGSNIYFAPGQYRPDTASGRKLITHEVAHVDQAHRGLADSAAHAKSLLPGTGADRLERWADDHERRFADAGRPERTIGSFRIDVSRLRDPGEKARVERIGAAAIELAAHELARVPTDGVIDELTVHATVDPRADESRQARALAQRIVADARARARPLRSRAPLHGATALRKITLKGTPWSPEPAFVNQFQAPGREYLTTLDKSATTYDYDDGRHLARDVSYREAIVEGMHQANFGGGARYFYWNENPYLDGDYWTEESRLSYVSKKGVKPSVAVRRIFEKKNEEKKSKLECLSLTVAVEYYGLLRAIGDEEFDRRFPDGLRFSQYNPKSIERTKIESDDDLQPGDWVYFKNHASYLNKHPEGYWQGENAVYDGKNKNGERVFSGFGAAGKTETEMRDELAKMFNQDPSEQDKAHPGYWPEFEKMKITPAEVPGVLKDHVRRPTISSTRLTSP